MDRVYKFIACLLLLMVSVAHAQRPSSGGSSYSSGTPSSSPKPSFTPSKPSTTSSSRPQADKAGIAAQQKQASQRSYKEATTKSTYVDKKTGQAKPYTPTDVKRVEVLRTKTTPEKIQNRTVRVEHHYHGYTNRPVIHYSDPFGPFFYLWLLDRSLEERATFAYHHQHEMDQHRYQDMLSKDAQLEARIRTLEAEKVARDPHFVPKELADDPDLMYSDEYVAAATEEHENGWITFLTIFVIITLAAIFSKGMYS
jgi:hypothetical protein